MSAKRGQSIMGGKYVLVPDSFKGTMSSSEICGIMRHEILKHDPAATVISIPVADGGEGTVDCFLEALAGERIPVTVTGPFMDETVDTYYGLIHQGRTAVMEMASCAGLPLAEGRLDPLLTTTYGLGQMVLHAAQKGVERIIIGLGGSCTNDGGCGAAAAIGVRFRNGHGDPFVPTGGTLQEISHIDRSGIDGSLKDLSITAMCDIDNPLYGPTGAAHVFGPQKGADEDAVALLDSGLRRFDALVKQDTGRDCANIPGSGAAGGLGAGMMVFFGAELQMGIETVLDTVSFDKVCQGADLVFTGEGRLDQQSLGGKVVVGVARRAQKQSVPVIAVVGDIGDRIDAVYGMGVSCVLSINRVAVPFPEAKKRARGDLALTMDTVMRLFRTLKSQS